MKVHIGEFEAEDNWKDESAAVLPNINNTEIKELITLMDELLFGFTELDDILITRKSFNQVLKSYLEELGFQFSAFSKKEYKDGIKILSEQHWTLEPYAITDYVCKAYSSYKIGNNLPDLNVVRKVNSKKFSSLLSSELNCNPFNYYLVENIVDLEKILIEINDIPIIIKEYFGVSGKGSLVLNSSASKKSILKYLKRQNQIGEKINFIIEPYLNKNIDFSTQIYISESGKISILAERMMLNSSLCYHESFKMHDSIRRTIDRKNYFDTINKIGNYLYKEGYWGAVGIDSMILDANEIVPLVEINARKSMGLLQYSLEMKLNLESCESYLSYLNIKRTSSLYIEELLSALNKKGILYKKNKEGILPLSANILNISKSRLSYLLVAQNGRKDYFYKKLQETLFSLGIQLFPRKI